MLVAAPRLSSSSPQRWRLDWPLLRKGQTRGVTVRGLRSVTFKGFLMPLVVVLFPRRYRVLFSQLT